MALDRGVSDKVGAASNFNFRRSRHTCINLCDEIRTQKMALVSRDKTYSANLMYFSRFQSIYTVGQRRLFLCVRAVGCT